MNHNSGLRSFSVLMLIMAVVAIIVPNCQPRNTFSQPEAVSGILGTVTAEHELGIPERSSERTLSNVATSTQIPPALQWELTEFTQEGYQLGSEKRDLGIFRNMQTGEIVQAYCLDPTAPDPTPRNDTVQGDVFYYNNGGNLERIDGASGQRFQKITFQPFESTLTPQVPTVTSTLTAQSTATITQPTVVFTTTPIKTTVASDQQNAAQFATPTQQERDVTDNEPMLPIWAIVLLILGSVLMGTLAAFAQISRRGH